MVAQPGWNPEDYEVHRKALGYLAARTLAPETADDYIRPLLEEMDDPYLESLALFSAMGSIAGMLLKLRAAEVPVPEATTLEQLGKLIAPPDE